MADRQDDDLNRKMPRQARSRMTVATLLETTARILEEEGSACLTTNHIAERSGFSIGTVYQYFPNREAIVLALIERQRRETGDAIQAVVAQSGACAPEERIRRIIHILHAAFNLHRKPQQRLLQALLHLAAEHGLPTPSDDAAAAILHVWQQAAPAATPLNASELFVLTHAVIEVLRQATLQSSALLGSVELESAILRMVMGFLHQHGDGAGSGSFGHSATGTHQGS